MASFGELASLRALSSYFHVTAVAEGGQARPLRLRRRINCLNLRMIIVI